MPAPKQLRRVPRSAVQLQASYWQPSFNSHWILSVCFMEHIPKASTKPEENFWGCKRAANDRKWAKMRSKGFIWGCTGFIWGCTGFLFGGARHPFVPRWLRACPKVKIAILSTINTTIIYTILHNMSKQIVKFSKHNTTLISVKNL